MNDKINIAIDGYSSCGKSTIAKAISKRYQMRYIDTGLCIWKHLFVLFTK